MPEALPGGWQDAGFNDELWRLVSPDKWIGVAPTSNGWTPCGPFVGPTPRGIYPTMREAIAVAERLFCGCRVKP